MLNFILSPVRLLYNFFCLISSILSYFVHPFYAWINFSCRFFVLAWIYALAKCFPPFIYCIEMKFVPSVLPSNHFFKFNRNSWVDNQSRSFVPKINWTFNENLHGIYVLVNDDDTHSHTHHSQRQRENALFFSLHRNSFKIYYETLAKMQRDKNKAASDCDCNCISLSVVFAWIR